MKILISSFTFPPQWDGVSMASLFLAETFRDAGHEVQVATDAGAPDGRQEDHPPQISVHAFSIHGSSLSPEGYTGDVEAYHQLLRDYRPDIVFIQCYHTWHSDLTMEMRGEIGFKSVLISHGYTHHMIEKPWGFPPGVRRWWRRRPLVRKLRETMRQYDHLVFLSSRPDHRRFYDVHVAQRYGMTHWSAIPNSTDISKDADGGHFRSKYGIGSRLMLFYPANYSPRKNQSTALACFEKAQLEGACLVFIGSKLGEYGEELKRQWQRKHPSPPAGEDSVLFLEGLPRSEFMEAYAACDLVLLAAHAETQPIVLLEAMAYGKPFLSTNTGCVRDFSGGVVVNSNKEFTAAMRQLASDEDRRHQLGEQGLRQHDDSYSPSHVKSLWLQLLEQYASCPRDT